MLCVCLLYLSDAPRQVTVSTYPSSAVVALNRGITLYCSSDGLPQPTYHFRHYGNILNGNKEWKLEIRNVKVKDAGNYTCEARNFLGMKESLPTVVNVERKLIYIMKL